MKRLLVCMSRAGLVDRLCTLRWPLSLPFIWALWFGDEGESVQSAFGMADDVSCFEIVLHSVGIQERAYIESKT